MKRNLSPSFEGVTTQIQPTKRKRKPVPVNLAALAPTGDKSTHSITQGSNKFEQVSRDFLIGSGKNWRLFTEEELPGAEVFYLPDFIDVATAMTWRAELDKLDTWHRPTLKVYGREVIQSRLTAVYATTPELTMKYSGQVVKMHYPYPNLVSEIQRLLEKTLGFGLEDMAEGEGNNLTGFNHVMLNKYDDGSVYIGQHSDSRENKVIASLSLGAPRTFIMTPRKGSPGEKLKWTLDNGSLMIMQGDTQLNWKHKIPKEPKVKEGRISLTFRQLVYENHRPAG
ncbi:uncharacterized protein EI90DRAFT_2966451 [Cantharellus anzutake]|uniref:uncharacterized protein n=1 Tax=Cantharellus anzutake TaxID=1750568 RepID=UPI00190783AA|nr:uncharacterized protein EI90DRAFT_2966451 [Cantharellus anzutake]KAF8340572.1 hypothetical protein EI90DRAFT_2966451 [Cantharellus anzutake]